MHIRSNKTLAVLFRPILLFSQWLETRYPETYVMIRYFLRFGTFPNLQNPITLNEKILFLSLRTDTTLWTYCADKWNVRNYLHECGLDEIAVPLYGVWERAEDIDFEQLPNSFVLKSTHGSGDIVIVEDKKKINPKAIIAKFRKVLSERTECAPHYLRIQPRIVAEALLHNDAASARYSTSLIDYKVWCFNAKPSCIYVCCNRNSRSTEVMTYDLDWVAHPEYTIFDSRYKESIYIPKPQQFEKMLFVCQTLAKPFECVRVDLYNISGVIYFGELTFTPLGGLNNTYSAAFLNESGRKVDLTYNNY